MRGLLEDVLLLQPDWSSANTPAMAQRGVLVRREIAAWLRERLPELAAVVPAVVDDLRVEGRDGTGRKTEIPWVRVYSASRSPSATEGWYVVYLFSAEGDRVYLSMNQGTTRWENGEFRPRPASELRARVVWARQLLADQLAARPDLLADISLEARASPLGAGYEAGNVAAFSYPLDAIPAEEQLERDLRFLVAALGQLYTGTERAVAVPGEPAPEVADAVTAVERAAGRRLRGQGFRLSARERLAIERRAVQLATEHLVAQRYKVKDVGATQSYDLDARRDQERLFVEVKGTTSPGVEVILTKAEVELHGRKYPHTMLIVVSSIGLDREADPPAASGGVLHVVHPWNIESQDLTPLAYRYVVPPAGVGAAPAPSDL